MKHEANPFDIQEAWRHVGELYAFIVSLFGAPFDLAERLMLVRKSRREILAWLGPAEALARRLLLLRALTLPRPNDPPPRATPGRVLIAFSDRPIEDIHIDSAKWRVRFCVMPRGVLRRPRGGDICTDRRGGGVDFNALPLARRLEALRRVLEHPAPAVARLARLLAARRDDVVSAFRPYRPSGGGAQTALDTAQRELDLALNTS